MGAFFDSFQLSSMNEASAIEAAQVEIAESESDHGSGAYSGCIGQKSSVLVVKKLFCCRNEAWEYISEKSDKWDNFVIIARYVDVESDRAVAKILKKIKKEQETIDQSKSQISNQRFAHGTPDGVIEKSINRVKNQKSELKTCRSCNSKIAVKHIKSERCPVCNDDLFTMTSTDLKKISALNTKIKESGTRIEILHTELAAAKQQAVSKITVTDDSCGWVGGAWCAS